MLKKDRHQHFFIWVTVGHAMIRVGLFFAVVDYDSVKETHTIHCSVVVKDFDGLLSLLHTIPLHTQVATLVKEKTLDLKGVAVVGVFHCDCPVVGKLHIGVLWLVSERKEKADVLDGFRAYLVNLAEQLVCGVRTFHQQCVVLVWGL